MIYRVWLVAAREIGHNLRRPMFWVWFILFAFMVWGLANGNLRIATSGDSSVGGNKQWLTSEFSYAQLQTAINLLLGGFFVAIAFGLCIIRDEELKVHPLLLSTPLTAGEYVWGKFLGNVASVLLILLLQTAAAIVCYHIYPSPIQEEIRGPFALMNYVRPVVVFSLPMMMFIGGISFAVGEWTRRSVLVFVLPTILLMFFGLFLGGWSPGWLPTRANEALMLIDPFGFRWLRETWLKVDRGALFYNTQPMVVNTLFSLSRLGFVLLGGLVTAWTARHFSRSFRAVRHGTWRRQEQARGPEMIVGPSAPLNLPAMHMRAPGFLRGAWTVARFELRLLLGHPGVYIFVPFIVLQAIGEAELKAGAFDTPILQTSGTLAIGLMNTLTMLVCLLLLFFSVDTIERERKTQVAPLLYSTGIPTSSILFGKTLATALAGALILCATLLACLVLLLIQGTVPLELGPFGLVWGGMLVPTFLVWAATVTLLSVVTRNRYTTLALAAAILAVTFYRQFTGHMNWVGNWNLWSITQWSDISRFELDGKAILLNRLFVLSLTVLLAYGSVRLLGRQEYDATGVLRWFRPKSLARSAIRLAPLLLVPLVLGSWLWLSVLNGFQGETAKRRQKDYWRQNLATWKDAPTPALQHVELDLQLSPHERWFRVRGHYRLKNLDEKPMQQVALTTGLHWSHEKWTLDDLPVTPEDRSRLQVFSLTTPLEPGQTVRIGFDYEGYFPAGISKNGGGTSEFILPSGVVLTSFTPSFVPIIGFLEQVGVDDENHYESRQYADDFHRGDTLPLFGFGDAFSTKITIRGPRELTYNSVGVLTDSHLEGEQRVVTWESDQPVNFFNVVAGQWELFEGKHSKVYFAPAHSYNINEIGLALDSAYIYYSQWFMPYPWRELKLSEFANLATYAQGFPTNITFSEGIGFLTRNKPGANAPFLIAAHEAAHQWWGNLLVPGKGPGGNVISEGMAHFSTGLLIEQVKGLAARIEFFEGIERSYNEHRSADAERPLVKIDGSKNGDSTVMYDKGGWVFWMLLNHLGREKTLQGLQQFIRDFRAGHDHPVLQDLVAAMRSSAADPVAYDDFTRQWFLEVVVPHFQLQQVVREIVPDGKWQVTAKLANIGTGRIAVEVAATNGDRFDKEAQPLASYQDQRVLLTIGPGESVDVRLDCPFEPKHVLVDPDARVLQLKRKLARHKF